jgi:signal transduction histidine kinase
MFNWKPGLILLYFWMVHFCAWGFRFDDKSTEKPILATEKKKLEQLITKASYLASIKSDSCMIFAEEALRLARAYNSDVLEGEALNVIANYYFDKEQYKEALDYFHQLLAIYKQTGDSIKKAGCHNLIGRAYFNLGIYDEAIRAYHNAMRLAMNHNDTLLIAKCNQNIGVLYAEMNKPQEAMSYYKKALDLHRVLKNREDEAGVLQNIGIISFNDKNHKDALGYYLSALKIYNELKDSLSMALMYVNLGNLYEDQNDFRRSLDYYNRALNVFLKEDYKYGIAFTYLSLGSVFKKTGEYERSLEFLQRSLQYSKMISLLENQVDCHKELSDVYFALEDHKSAYEELAEYQVLHDSLFNEHMQEQVTEMEMRYRTQLKDKEIENLKSEREQAVKDMIRRTIGLTAIVTLTFIIIVVSVYYSRSLKKANDRLKNEVDERARAEKELLSIKESLEERVTERTSELAKAKQKAEESDQLKSAFIANMSHELRTPLNAITGFSGLLLRNDITPEKKKEYNDQIIKNNKILVNMIEDLIDTSKIESGNLQLHPVRINVEHLLGQMNEPLFENMAKKNKPFIEIIQEKTNGKTEAIVADPVRLQQVLWHLLDNAVKFTNNGSIRYGCFENHQNMIFFVEDSGIGIPEEYKDVIFEKFRQIDQSAKRKYGGTGLGLYYARKIAEMMGGKLWFEPRNEGGSVFYFSLPKE